MTVFMRFPGGEKQGGDFLKPQRLPARVHRPACYFFQRPRKIPSAAWATAW
jgi:hypothetical protein